MSTFERLKEFVGRTVSVQDVMRTSVSVNAPFAPCEGCYFEGQLGYDPKIDE